MDITARWAELVQGPERGLPLDEAALLISAHATGNVDVRRELRHLDEVAADCAEDSLGGLCELLFFQFGFRGNTDYYEDPRNSYLDQVLERRLGIPISLAVVTIEVGRRVGVPLQGVGMPGHFLVQPTGRAEHEPLLDVFNQRWMSVGECRELAGRLTGPGARWSSRWLAPTRPRAILARMLANLAAIHRENLDMGALGRVAELAAALPGRPPAERFQVAEDLAASGRLRLAARMYLSLAADKRVNANDVENLRAKAATLRARLN
ncbi:MAG: transglutaminase family protein [Acidimicrobiaceae bacterium]|nr:transglutaminase family protein [Acidimicrobiaceae bacterium]